MTTVAFVWSDFKSDEAFLEHMKKTMAELNNGDVKHVRVAYDNKQIPNDGAAAWLKFLDESVIAEHAATIETLAFDIEFSVNLMGYPSYPGCFRFAVGGGAAFKAFNHLMSTMRELSQRENVDVTICGVKRRDMQFVVVDEIPNPSPTSEPKPKPTTQVYGHRLNAKTGQIEAVMGVSDDAKWTHFDTATTETEYVVSMGELPENVPIQVVVDADGKSVRVKNEDYDYMDPTKRPTTWVGRTFLVPHDAIASTISAERSGNSISVRIKRNADADAAVPSDLWPVSGNGHVRKIPIVENEA